MKLRMLLAGFLFLVGLGAVPAQAQTLKQIDSLQYSLTTTTPTQLTFHLSWRDGNTLSDTLAYEVAWYDVDTVNSRQQVRVDTVRLVKQTDLAMTRTLPWTAAQYDACVRPMYPKTKMLWLCTYYSYVNYDTTGRRPPKGIHNWQAAEIVRNVALSQAAIGDTAQIVFHYDVETIAFGENSSLVPTSKVCPVLVTRNLRVYQPGADAGLGECLYVFDQFFRTFGWKRGRNPAVQAVADTITLPPATCTLPVQDGLISLALVCSE